MTTNESPSYSRQVVALRKGGLGTFEWLVQQVPLAEKASH
jgi:hypothetical protein